MRVAVGILEALLAVAFFGTILQQVIGHSMNAGAVGFATDIVLLLAGAYFAKLAYGNFKAPAAKLEQSK
jgi:hypothetical protein